ncbi:MAG TPA: GAF domain-containing protein [Stellaceae bacterium]|nr:GAF domain-containing protein [Stellaceae bacterium]
MAPLDARTLPHEVPLTALTPAERQSLRRAFATPRRSGGRACDLLSRFLLVEVVNSALRSLSLDELLARLVALVVTTLDADRGTIFLDERDEGELVSRIAQGSEIAEIRIPRTSGIAGAVLQSGRAEIVDDAPSDPRFNPTIDECTGYRTRSVVCVPLRDLDGATIGTVEILNKRKGRFDRVDVGLLQAIADQAGTALEHARAFESERRERQRDQSLIEATEAILVDLDVDRLLVKIIDAACRLLDAERATLFLYDAASGELVSRTTAGGDVAEIRFGATLGVAGACFASGETIAVANAYHDPRFNQAVDAATGFQTRNLLAVRLTEQTGKPTGVLEVLNKRFGVFTSGDERRLRLFSAQAASVLQNAQLFTDVLSLKNYTEGLLRMLSDGVVTLDRGLGIVEVNEAARRILHVPGGAVLTGSAEALWGKENPWLIESLTYVATTGGTDDRPDVEFLAADGTIAYLNATAAPQRDAAGAVVGITLVLQDISRQKKVQSVVTRYMARQFAERVLEGGSEPAPSSSHIATVLFSDIRRFTSMAEALTPQATVEMLNEYFAEMAAVVQQYGGALDKYIGDAVMAVFGAPVAGPADADNAITAANEMIRALRQLNLRRMGRGASPIEIGVGIATGEVAAGALGGASRLDYTVIGDTVNLASRLEGANKHYRTTILLSGTTVDHARLSPRLRQIDLIRVKGKAQPTEILEALDHHVPESQAQLDTVLPWYADGIRFYRARDWSRALLNFSRVLEVLPHDGPSWIHADRCLYYREHPPREGWDGVWTMKSK